MLLDQNKPLLYILMLAIDYGMSASLFAGGAIAISTFIPNKFTVIVSPIVVYFLLLRLVSLPWIPTFIKNINFVKIYPHMTPMTAFLFKLLSVTIVLIVFLLITINRIQKRWEHHEV